MKDTCDFYYDWLSNQPYSAYYDAIEIRQHYQDVKAAVLNISGWYDEAYGSEGATTNFLGLLASRAQDTDKETKLIVGPWIHGVDATETAMSGDRKFPESSRIDYDCSRPRLAGLLCERHPERCPKLADGAGVPDGGEWRRAVADR